MAKCGCKKRASSMVKGSPAAKKRMAKVRAAKRKGGAALSPGGAALSAGGGSKKMLRGVTRKNH